MPRQPRRRWSPIASSRPGRGWLSDSGESVDGESVESTDSGLTSLHLAGIAFVSATEATFSGTATSGVLTVTDGTHIAHITLIGDYTGATFVTSSDHHGKAIVVALAGPAGAPKHRFIAAAASLGGACNKVEPAKPAVDTAKIADAVKADVAQLTTDFNAHDVAKVVSSPQIARKRTSPSSVQGW